MNYKNIKDFNIDDLIEHILLRLNTDFTGSCLKLTDFCIRDNEQYYDEKMLLKVRSTMYKHQIATQCTGNNQPETAIEITARGIFVFESGGWKKYIHDFNTKSNQSLKVQNKTRFIKYNMKPLERINLIKKIAIKFSESDYTYQEINFILQEYEVTDKLNEFQNKKEALIEILNPINTDTLITMADDLENELPQKENIVLKQSELEYSLKKIFISHASIDKEVVEKIIDLLKVIGISDNQIFCTSFEGYGIELGEDFLERIKNELNSDVLVLFILSSNFYNSPVCLCEMGTTWMKTTQHIPILIPPLKFSDIKGVIPSSQSMMLDDKEKLNSLKRKVENLFKIQSTDSSIWERKRDKILNEIQIVLSKLPKNILKVELYEGDKVIRKSSTEIIVSKLGENVFQKIQYLFEGLI